MKICILRKAAYLYINLNSKYMKSSVLSLFIIVGCMALFSCKDGAGLDEDNSTVATDTIPQQTAPEFMYVTAVSGLTLREHPNLQSDKLVVMPLGTKVKIISA